MGQGVKIILVNKTPYRWESSDISSYQLDKWDNSFPKYIDPGTASSVYVEFHKGPFTTESDDQGWITYNMLGTHGPRKFKIHGIYSDEAEIHVEFIGITPIGNGFSDLLGKSRKKYFTNTEELRVNIGLVGNETDGFLFFDRQQDNPNWMKFLDGSKKISRFTIPGTHDTLTYGLNEGLIKGLPDSVLTTLSESLLAALSGFLGPITLLGGITPTIILHATQCQRLNLNQQLEKGIRFLDIRLVLEGEKLEAYHGGIRLHINFDEVLSICKAFLNKNKSESIIMSIKDESNKETKAFSDAIAKYVSNTSLWYSTDDIPTLNEVRGKIVLFRRFNSHIQTDLGINANDGWPSNSTSWLKRKENDAVQIRVQDEYNNYVLGQLDHKFINYASPVLTESQNDTNENHLFVNFMSGTGGIYPETLANGYMSQFIGTNGMLFDHIALSTEKKYGIIPMDFPETPFEGILISQLIMQNQLSASGAFNTEIVSGNHYLIKPLYDLQKCADVEGAGTEAGTKVIVHTVNNGTNQQWIFEPAGDNYYFIHPVHANSLVLDVKGGEKSNGTPVIVFPKKGGDNQKWKLIDDGKGKFRISPKHAPDTALNLYYLDSTNGKQLVIHASSTEDLASHWEIQKS